MSSAETHETALVAIVGPTGSGKSVLGVALAERFGGEVVCCDSTQIYRHFDIGTAKVTLAEQSGIPHHLMNLLEPDEVFTAGEYRRLALGVLEDLRRRNKLPVFTAGTGLYLRALLEGLSDAPTRSDELRERLRQRAGSHGAVHLHRLLTRLDPPAAERIAAQDVSKMVRALEVRLLSGKPISELHRAGRPQLEGYRSIKVGLMPPRAALYERIERRVKSIVDAGWVEEVRGLLVRGVPALQRRPSSSSDTASYEPTWRARWLLRPPSAPSSKPRGVMGSGRLRGFAKSRPCSGLMASATTRRSSPPSPSISKDN